MLKGIIAAMATKFTPDGEHVDGQATVQLVEQMIADGVHGIVVGGSTGEFFTMTAEERKQQIDLVVKTVNKRVPVVAHSGCLSTRETVEMSKYCEAAGADVIIVVPSFYEALSERELIAHYAAIGAATKMPVMLYNIPTSSSNDILAGTAAKLVQVCNATCMKDSTGDLHRLYRITAATNGQVQAICGADSILMQAFAYGAQAAVLGVANAITRECVALYKLMVEQNDLVTARQLWDKFLPFQEFAETHGYIAVVKAACAYKGRDVGAPRQPILPLSAADQTEMEALLRELDTMSPLVDKVLAQ